MISKINVCRKHNRFQTYGGHWLDVKIDLKRYIAHNDAVDAEFVSTLCDKCYAKNQLKLGFKGYQ